MLKWQRHWPRSSPRLLREESGLNRLDEDPVRVVSETLQRDAAGACLFSYLLEPNQTATATGFVALVLPMLPPIAPTLGTPFFSIITIAISI